MVTPSRQVAFDTSSIISIVWFLIIVGVLCWFYNTMKRIGRTLEDIKKLLEGKTQGGT